MNKLITFFILIFFVFNVNALDLNLLSVSQITVDPVFSSKIRVIDYNVLIQNTFSSNADTKLILSVDHTDVNSFFITVPSQSIASFIISWNANILPFTETNHEITARIESTPLDDNSLNNSAETFTRIYKGFDLQAVSIQLPTAMKLNENYDVNIQFKSNDYNILNYFSVEVMDQNFMPVYFETFPYLTSNEIQTKTFKYYTNTADFTLTLKVDPVNLIDEYDETNNVFVIHKIISDKPDIRVVNVRTDPAIYIGKPTKIYFDLENIGGITASNFIVASYYDLESNSNNLLWQTVPSIESNETKTYSFVFTPLHEGTYKIIIKADATNVLNENDKINNYYELTIQAIPEITSTMTYLLAVNLWKECNVTFSNGHTISNKGFDENFTQFWLLYTDNLSNVLYNNYVKAEDQLHLNNATVKVIYVSNGQAQVVVAFNEPTSIITSTCDIAYNELMTDLNNAQSDYIKCRIANELADEKLKKTYEELDNCNTEKKSLTEQNTLLQTLKNICDGNIAEISAKYNMDLSNAIKDKTLEFQKQIEAKNQIIEQNKELIKKTESEATFFQVIVIVILTIIALVIGYLLYMRRMADPNIRL